MRKRLWMTILSMTLMIFMMACEEAPASNHENAGQEAEFTKAPTETPVPTPTPTATNTPTPTPHTHKYTEKVTKKPTYEKTGTKKFTCSCGDNYTETIPAIGYIYTELKHGDVLLERAKLL